jgi:hypothetical protein
LINFHATCPMDTSMHSPSTDSVENETHPSHQPTQALSLRDGADLLSTLQAHLLSNLASAAAAAAGSLAILGAPLPRFRWSRSSGGAACGGGPHQSSAAAASLRLLAGAEAEIGGGGGGGGGGGNQAAGALSAPAAAWRRECTELAAAGAKSAAWAAGEGTMGGAGGALAAALAAARAVGGAAVAAPAHGATAALDAVYAALLQWAAEAPGAFVTHLGGQAVSNFSNFFKITTIMMIFSPNFRPWHERFNYFKKKSAPHLPSTPGGAVYALGRRGTGLGRLGR